jgi:hypothetical protein
LPFQRFNGGIEIKGVLRYQELVPVADPSRAAEREFDRLLLGPGLDVVAEGRGRGERQADYYRVSFFHILLPGANYQLIPPVHPA